MTLSYETLNVPGDDGLFISTYTADVGSPSEEKLRLLLSWNSEPPRQGHGNPARESRQG
jgi:hypothetical protein